MKLTRWSWAVAVSAAVSMTGVVEFAPARARDAAASRVLRVGSFHGVRGQFRTIQAAVDAARPGDWVLVGPGDYHERGDYRVRNRSAADESGGAVWIAGKRKAGLHVRGMDRNRVMVDGTKPGSARCSRRAAAQDPGPRHGGKPLGRNGIDVFKTDGVTVENLSACNFLGGSGGGGNQIWFNGGDGSGKVGMGRYTGRYLNATSTYWVKGKPEAGYGLFASNARGPGLIDRVYASNMADSDFYVGACPDCNAVLRRSHAQYGALGYSGTNSGGHLVIESSEWDHNKTGIVTNSQNNDDAPSPQDGRCLPRSDTKIRYCTYFRNNHIHDNNNPNVPSRGVAGFGPVGTGIVVSGGRFDTVQGNLIEDNDAWGALFLPYPDSDDPPPVAHCQGGTLNGSGFKCFYDDWGNRLLDNRFRHNGSYGNPSNTDFGDISGQHTPGNCAKGNTNPAGFTSDPADYQTSHGDCTAANAGNSLGSTLTAQVICDTEALGPCPPAPGMMYPRRTKAVLPGLRREATMPNPCAGVPANPWCRRGR